APGRPGRDATGPLVPLERGDPLPGFVVEVLGLQGGSGPGGNFRAGDRIRVRFTVKDHDGEDVPRDQWNRLQMYVSGPTTNYQRVIASTDAIAASSEDLNNPGQWTFDLPALPNEYLEPFNYT